MSSSTANLLAVFALIFSADFGLVAADGQFKAVDPQKLPRFLRYAQYSLKALRDRDCRGDRKICSLLVSDLKCAKVNENLSIFECATSDGGTLILSIFTGDKEALLMQAPYYPYPNESVDLLLNKPLSLNFEEFTRPTAGDAIQGDALQPHVTDGSPGQDAFDEQDTQTNKKDEATGGGVIVGLFVMLSMVGIAAGLFLLWQRYTKRPRALSGGLNT